MTKTWMQTYREGPDHYYSDHGIVDPKVERQVWLRDLMTTNLPWWTGWVVHGLFIAWILTGGFGMFNL